MNSLLLVSPNVRRRIIRGGTAYDLAGINKTSYVISNYSREQQQGLILNFKI